MAVRPRCFFLDFPNSGPCEGRLTRAHLVKRQVLEREGHGRRIHDPRSWIWVCGGITGCSGHHGAMDHARTLRIPRNMLPAGFVAMMEEIGMDWYLAKHYSEPRS